ncbi:hypothetical protein [Roseateles amylovorans]|uniref:MFS transporter n=1 Tax=Roseateles amylovorans TaxID=2978473 RepID=A0ABY6B0L3_9BURK|nr:hypothetical protein [Roseateles amylovorans]UXH78595.1 hypothetical protein N4261_01250 [Roseateles amylovorans]
MSRGRRSGWTRQLWSGLWTGLCESGAYIAMQYGMAASMPQMAVMSAPTRPGE